MKKLIDNGDLGEVRYIYSQRLNLGRIRADIDALWNFAPHDISIIQYWLGDPEPFQSPVRAWLTCRTGSMTLSSSVSSILGKSSPMCM